MKIKFYIFALVSVCFSCASAFEWKRCREGITRVNLQYGGTFSIFTTSGQFSSSTGECAAIGLYRSEDRDRFIASNISKLKEEAAKGGGETVFSLAELYGCRRSQEAFAGLLQKNYVGIFNQTPEDKIGFKIQEYLDEKTDRSLVCFGEASI